LRCPNKLCGVLFLVPRAGESPQFVPDNMAPTVDYAAVLDAEVLWSLPYPAGESPPPEVLDAEVIGPAGQAVPPPPPPP
jgi:hypothetical protein